MIRSSLPALVLLASLAGCDGATCDEDQRYSHGLCYEVETDADTATGFAHFGDACGDPVQCEAPTDFCMTGVATTSYCTRTGCLADPSICPPSWTCLDLSILQPGLPAVCKRP